jgi:hypothetical protein
MIRYSLKCSAGHDFDSWFQNGDAYAALRAAGHVACPICGSAEVDKSLMAPAVRPARGDAQPAPPAAAEAASSLRTPQTELEAAMAELRRQIEANSEYVGVNFVTEARKMHQGETPERAIHGEARPEEARKLIEEGLPVAPLPFLPGRKVN